MAARDNFRSVAEADFDRTHAIYMHDSINPYMSFEQIPRQEYRACFESMSARDEFLFYQENGVNLAIFTLIYGKWRKQHVASIAALAVLPDHQGQGVASRMMPAVFDLLKQRHISRLELIVESDNPKAIKLYQKLGFEIEGTLRAYLKRENQDVAVDDYCMAILF